MTIRIFEMQYHFRKLFIFILPMVFVGSFFHHVNAQNKRAWELFEAVKFEDTFVEAYGMAMPWPAFTKADMAWQGKEVVIAGYIIPTAEASGFDGIIISKYPFSMCFFCGEAGIESVALLQTKGKMPDFDLDKPYVFRGKLKFNDEDFENLNFIVTDAVLTDL